jgi:sphingomyelin phosphodiesterase acid-like 3
MGLFLFVVILCLAEALQVKKKEDLVGSFFQLTDVHGKERGLFFFSFFPLMLSQVNPWYRVGADVFNTKCNNLTNSSSAVPAGPWGNYHCESPWRLVNSALAFMQGQASDFVMWTGDDSPMNEKYPLPSPDLHMTQQHVFDIVANLTASLAQFHVIPSLGNHEVWQPSQLPAPDAKQTIEIFATIGELWKAQGWLEGAEYVRFLAEGQCVTRPVAGLVKESLFFLLNFWCLISLSLLFADGG